MRLGLCIFLLLAGPWLGPAWLAPSLELHHERQAQLLPDCPVDQESVAKTRPVDSNGGDQTVCSILGASPAVPRQFPGRTEMGWGFAEPTRRLLINIHTSSYL